ncbi:3-phosphoshikimate 1-carboxyvinyltransferase [Salipaludibacillus sp. CF4.18]|uniref:3-phosphoshikimate 1-carboxyvinyltransferase n=1 Tax=Salipaludibacillus sp. CF4.18 TaxID=3373081 RepID=UPI003EE5DD30
MSQQLVEPLKQSLQGTIEIPGDKSISHRAVLFASLAEGKTTIYGFLRGDDCLSTIACMKSLGIKIEENEDRIVVHGKGLQGFQEPQSILDVGNSGTTIRLLSGVLAGQEFSSVLIGDDSIAKRPMARVTGPLKMMNATIDGRSLASYTPLHLRGGSLKGIDYHSPVASAQVKSAILLAGLYATGTTKVTEPSKSRDHSERMLESFGVHLEVTEKSVSLVGGQELQGTTVQVPGDISSAAFMLVAGAVVPGSDITLKNVGINPTRSGMIDVLLEMGANLEILNKRHFGSEPVADLRIQYSALKGTTISGDLIPRLIDEIPAIAVLASQATGKTVIKDAEELKVKETNRIDTVVNQLKLLGVGIEATDDGMIIHGNSVISGGTVESYHDHRIGMAMALCGLISKGNVTVKDTDAIAVSYPTFFEDLRGLMKEVN